MNGKSKKIILIILIIIFILFILIQIAYKSLKNGNNISKSTDDIIEYILNLSSYEATVEVTINSNKTTNKYMLKQYYLNPNYSKQIVKEPKNIENLETIFNGKSLEVRNTNLSLSKIYEKYQYLNDNILWLNSFTQNYKNINNNNIEENEKEIILKNNLNNNYKEILYINKKNRLPIKIEILDNNNNTKVYIEYKEIKLNNIHENNVFAFKLKGINKEV